jgi:hypothetical protein
LTKNCKQKNVKEAKDICGKAFPKGLFRKKQLLQTFDGQK